MWLGSDYLKGIQMRIPVTQADWPAAFNNICRLVSKNWPLGKLKFEQSREITAYLFGYHSIHDLQKELPTTSIPDNSYNANCIIQSMSLRALVKFNLSPLITKSLFGKLPWRSLSAWEGTQEAYAEIIDEKRRSAGLPRILIDEWAVYVNYKTPEPLIKMIDQGLLPDSEYAVNAEGLMYRRSSIERLLSELDISQKDLTELSYEGTQEQFISKYIEPIAWMPIEDQLKNVGYENKVEWLAPYLRRVEVKGSGYQIFHEGYNAYYSAYFNTEDELACALKELFLGNPISKGQLTDQDISINNEFFWRPVPLQEYSDMRSSEWLSTLAWPSSDATLTLINENTLPSIVNDDHDRVERWILQGYNRKLMSAVSADIDSAFALIINRPRRTLATLQEEGDFIPFSYEDDTPEDKIENLRECETRISKARSIGKTILEQHPELIPYFDEIAACTAYQNFNGNMRDWFYSCCKREMRFIIYVFGKECIKHFNSSCTEWRKIASHLLSDMITKSLTYKQCEIAWSDACGLLQLFKKQNEAIINIRKWTSHEKTDNTILKTFGEAAILTRKSNTEFISDLMRSSRK